MLLGIKLSNGEDYVYQRTNQRGMLQELLVMTLPSKGYYGPINVKMELLVVMIKFFVI